ncbi:MAG: hypothetical protein GY938_16370 [Ketobacter sp.]|nr:hypothetical protein [Ketobacter sp.]
MLPKYLFYIAFGTLILSGCGLETDDDEDDSSVTTVVVDVNQSPYLPLTNATQFFYTETGGSPGAVEGSVTYDLGTSNSKGYSVYKVAISGGNVDMELYFRTTTNQIELLGIDGPLGVSGSASVDHLRFATPIRLIGNRSDQTTAVTADVVYNGAPEDGTVISLTYDTTNTSNETVSRSDWTELELPTLKSVLTADINISVGGLSLDPFPIVMNFYFTKGLGLVQHSGDLTSSAGNEYEIKFHDLDALPNLIAFDQTGSNVEGTSSFFTLADGAIDTNISSTEYRIANLSALNALGWLEIEETNTDVYSVGIDTASDALPDSLTSVQVIFENRYSSGERLSASVTLLAP